MATHYDTLGIGEDAPTEDVRRSYLALARTLHPDRTVGARPAEAEQAARRMQDVNEAWRVLGEPGRRAAYDRTLADRRRATVTPGPSPWTTPGRDPRFDEDDDLDVPFVSAMAQPGDIGVSVVRALPWVVVGVVLLVIFVFSAFAGKEPDVSGPRALVGKCIVSGGASQLTPVPCAGPNEGEVVLVVDRASLCPDGTSGMATRGSTWLCLQPNQATDEPAGDR